MTELLFELGVGDRIVGATRFCDEPPAARAIQRVGGFVDIDVETVLSLRPDLVVTVKNSGNIDTVRKLEKHGLRVYWTALTTEADVFRVTEETARLVDRVDEGAAINARLRAALAALETRLRGAERRRVLVVYGHRPVVVAGSGSFANDLVTRGGGLNVAHGGGGAYPRWTIEEVIRAAPDVIIDNAMVQEESAHGNAPGEDIWANWPSLPAVRNNRVCRLGGSSALRPGVRLDEALETFARCIHPERFPDMPAEPAP